MTCFLDEFLCVILVTFVKSGEGVSIGCYKVIFCLTNGWISERGIFGLRGFLSFSPVVTAFAIVYGPAFISVLNATK